MTDDEDIKAGVRELLSDYTPERRGLGRRREDYGWRHLLAKNTPLLIGLLSTLLMIAGALFGQVIGDAMTDKAKILAGMEDMRKWVQNIDSRVQTVEQALPRYGDDASRSLRMMEDMQRENLRFWKANAEDRGDDAAVRRLEKKLKALPQESPTPGQ